MRLNDAMIGLWATGCLVLAIAAHAAESDDAQRAKDERIVQTVLRISGIDLSVKPDTKAAVLRYLARIEGEEKYFEIVEKLHLAGDVVPSLLKQAVLAPESNLGVNCVALLLKADKFDSLKAAIDAKEESALALITALGLSGQPEGLPLVEPIVTDEQRSVAVRVAAVRAVGKLPAGEKFLLDLAARDKLPAELKFAAANVLLNSTDEVIKLEAAKYLTLPATADAKPLPAVAQLVKFPGDANAGKLLFENKGTCAKCHIVNGQGKEVGPNLSEIGSKLSKEALYVSILDPSAGVSFNFETSQVVTDAGQIVVGIVVSDTAEMVTLKTVDAITRTFAKSEVEEINRIKTSLMPADLQRQLTAQELVDIVEYLTTLKKK